MSALVKAFFIPSSLGRKPSIFYGEFQRFVLDRGRRDRHWPRLLTAGVEM